MAICFPLSFTLRLLETSWGGVFETKVGHFWILGPLLNHLNSIKSYHYFIETEYWDKRTLFHFIWWWKVILCSSSLSRTTYSKVDTTRPWNWILKPEKGVGRVLGEQPCGRWVKGKTSHSDWGPSSQHRHAAPYRWYKSSLSPAWSTRCTPEVPQSLWSLYYLSRDWEVLIHPFI